MLLGWAGSAVIFVASIFWLFLAKVMRYNQLTFFFWVAAPVYTRRVWLCVFVCVWVFYLPRRFGSFYSVFSLFLFSFSTRKTSRATTIRPFLLNRCLLYRRVFISKKKGFPWSILYKYIHCTTPNHAKIYVYTIYYNTKSIIWYPTSTDDKMNLECFLINMGILTWHRSPWYFVWHKYDRIRFCNKRMLSEYLSINKFLGKWRWSCCVCILMTCRSRNLLLLSCHRNNKRGFIDVGTTKRPIFLDNDCIDCQPHTNEK
jgi:hypothetical protein